LKEKNKELKELRESFRITADVLAFRCVK